MRQIVFVWLLFGCIILYGQNNYYEIFAIQNDVRQKSRGASCWAIPQKGMKLGLLDSIYLAKNSQIRILDIRTNEVYRSEKPGYYRVKDIRDQAKKQSSDMLSAVYAQLKNSNAPNETSTMRVVGATLRGSQSESIEDSLAHSIIAIGNDVFQNNTQYTSTLRLNMIPNGDYVYFNISNLSDKDYCINIARYDNSLKKVSLCYDINPTMSEFPYIVIPAHQTLELSMWQFLSPSDAEQYILIATEFTYDTSRVQKILQRSTWNNTDLRLENPCAVFSPCK